MTQSEAKRPLKPHQGTLILVLGAVSLFGPGLIVGPIAWMLGSQDQKRMDAGELDPSGRDKTRLGMRLGILGTSLSILYIVIALLTGTDF